MLSLVLLDNLIKICNFEIWQALELLTGCYILVQVCICLHPSPQNYFLGISLLLVIGLGYTLDVTSPKWMHVGSELFFGCYHDVIITSICQQIWCGLSSGKYCFSNGTMEGTKGSSAYCGGLY